MSLGNFDELKKRLENKESVVAYWGVIPTYLHFGHIIPLLELKKLYNKGYIIKILIADAHLYLRGEYNAENIKIFEQNLIKILKYLDINDFIIEYGSKIQLQSPKYMVDLLKLSTLINLRDGITYAKCIVDKEKYPKINVLFYLIMQILDESALEADVEVGKLSQKKIFNLSRQYMPQIGYKKCSYILYKELPKIKLKNNSNTYLRFDKDIDFDNIINIDEYFIILDLLDIERENYEKNKNKLKIIYEKLKY